MKVHPYLKTFIFKASPVSNQKVFSCDDKEINGVSSGFIQSPNYPTYELGIDSCKIQITPPENMELKFYLLDLGLSDG